MASRKKAIREAFREGVFSRDKHTCKKCGSKESLDAHHITDRTLMPNGGYVLQNGISLCPECHLKAEKFHQTDGKEWYDSYHPDDLYRLIGSSLDIARRASAKIR